MKVYLVLIAFLISSNGFGQIKELRQAQETRKLSFSQGTIHPKNFSKSLYVNPFIGTGGHGHTYPGATAPFGMVQLSPDTRHTGWDGCSGYHYSDSIIYGFSHTHLSGTGVSDYGDLLIVPQNGTAKIEPGYEIPGGYGARFSHESEEATPGYYKVDLIDGNITARMTVSKRAGFHEYTFNNADGNKYILLDLDHRDKVLDASIKILDKNTIEGSRISEAWATEQHFYFYLKTDVSYKKATLIETNGKHKLVLTFSKRTKKVNVKVGISAVDVEGAKANLESEISDWNFNSARAKVTKDWNDELDKIYFYTKDTEVMTNFYTALYHSFLAPNIFNDTDGRYRGRDQEIHALSKEGGDQYTVFSLWDTYRATHPLFTLTQVKRTNDFVNTFLRQYEQGGDLPVWELSGNETECMIGYHSVSVIADAFVKGIRGFNKTDAIEAMNATSGFDEYGKIEFKQNGFIDAGSEPESVSKSLEYAYDNFCISQMAGAINKEFGARGTPPGSSDFGTGMYNFINNYDPQTKFMRARRSGQWSSPFDPSEVNFNYTEANSWQYSMYAPHAVGILTNLLGGKDSLETWLDRLFTTESSLSGREQADITGLIGQYAHGNEPSHHMAYLYNYTNASEKTQFYVDKILHEMYFNAPDGLSGNEDCGQMSSWYVLSAMGIYQIAPGNPYYEFGRPLMDEAIVYYENGKFLTIKVFNNSKKSKYIQNITLNGKPLYRNYIKHEELISGGILEIFMGESPNIKKDKYSHAPTLTRIPKTFIPVPYFQQDEHVFIDSMELSLSVVNPDSYVIHYTTDGSEPNTLSKIYSEPFTIHATTTIKAIALNEYSMSSVIQNEFVKKDQNVSLELKSEYDNQYAAGGKFTLIDGIRGKNEFRTGDWQGYWAKDLVAEVSFDEPRVLSEIGISCLSDIKSWIFFPRLISIQVSYDGENFESGGTIIIEDEYVKGMKPLNKEFVTITGTTTPIKKIKITVTNYGKCPDWHLGAGNDTWLFADEIILR